MSTNLQHEWIPAFLAVLRGCPNILKACQEVGVSRMTVHRLRKQDLQFDQACREAIQESALALEQKAHEMAMEGNVPMMSMMLKAHLKKYQDKSTVKHEGEQTVKVQVYMPDNNRDVKQEVIEGEVIKQITDQAEDTAQS